MSLSHGSEGMTLGESGLIEDVQSQHKPRLEGLPFSEASLIHYRIDEEHGDPFSLWVRGKWQTDILPCACSRLLVPSRNRFKHD
jgi:hypothetical protein